MSNRREVLRGGIVAALAASLQDTSQDKPAIDTPLRGPTGILPQGPDKMSIPDKCVTTVPADKREKILDGVDADIEAVDISDGQTPFPRQVDAWKKIVADFGQQYSPFNQATLQEVSEHEYLNARFHAAALNVDSGFKFNPATVSKSFRPQHADILLNQAADILDRCLRDRIEWEDKQVKWASLALEILDFLQRDDIHSREIEAGLYTTPAKEAEYEREARARTYQGMLASNDYTCYLQNSFQQSTAVQGLSDTEQLIAWLSVIGGSKDQKEVEWNGTKQQATAFAKDAAARLTEWNFWIQKLQALSAWTRSDWERAAAGFSEMAAAERERWLVRDIAFQRERSKQARRLVDLKVRLATEKGGAFNYREKMDCVSSRITPDFQDALARLQAAEVGLNQIFGYNHPLPEKLKLLFDPPADTSSANDSCYIDDCITWVRDAIAWLIRFSALDQSYVLTVSVRRHVDKTAWSGGLETGVWKFILTEGTNGDFPDFENLRLAGLSASVCGKELKGLWQTTLRIPGNGVYIRGGQKITIDQSDILACRLGRVGTRQLIQYPDVTGRTSLRNASPIGEWTVTLLPESTQGEKRKDVEDIEMDLELIHQ
jgi:hypothetical protein